MFSFFGCYIVKNLIRETRTNLICIVLLRVNLFKNSNKNKKNFLKLLHYIKSYIKMYLKWWKVV